ncbi:MAG TPA: RsmE family RNA methyltransferase [bacterium]|nr:MAG: Ribosomal RNA small subunit methyltransferase E [Parcubacteria group bacterium ADurb.Bin192]HPN15426.1 RsmE family RNA methyltransferase [bacterium]
MKQHRFCVLNELKPGKLLIQDPDLCHQINKVLRFKPGQGLVLFNQEGFEAEGVIDYLSTEKVEVSLDSPRQPQREPKGDTYLYCAVLKKENFALVVQKTTEIGIKNIIPLITERTVKQAVNLDRLRIIAKEASEQSGRVSLPVIHPVMDWSTALAHAAGHEVNYFFHTGYLSDAKNRYKSQTTGIFIGPEGGWSEKEVAEAKGKGLVFKSLSPLVLRAETAAILGAYVAVMPDSC